MLKSANISRASTCYTQRRKTKRVERKVGNLAAWGKGGSATKRAALLPWSIGGSFDFFMQKFRSLWSYTAHTVRWNMFLHILRIKNVHSTSTSICNYYISNPVAKCAKISLKFTYFYIMKQTYESEKQISLFYMFSTNKQWIWIYGLLLSFCYCFAISS